MFGILDGKGTYTVAVLTIIYAVAGLVIGQVDWTMASTMVLGSLQVMGLRYGIK